MTGADDPNLYAPGGPSIKKNRGGPPVAVHPVRFAGSYPAGGCADPRPRPRGQPPVVLAPSFSSTRRAISPSSSPLLWHWLASALAPSLLRAYACTRLSSFDADGVA